MRASFFVMKLSFCIFFQKSLVESENFFFMIYHIYEDCKNHTRITEVDPIRDP